MVQHEFRKSHTGIVHKDIDCAPRIHSLPTRTSSDELDAEHDWHILQQNPMVRYKEMVWTHGFK